MSMTPPDQPTMLITGASAGIGAAFARAYAQKGWDLVLVARRQDRLAALGRELQEAYNITAHMITLDLFKSEAVPELMTQLGDRGLHIDGLINNAGYGHPGLYLDSPWIEHARFNHLMVSVPCQLCHALLPAMIERGFGRIINVASLAGHMPGSRGHTLYAASKSYLIKFSQSLSSEMQGTGIQGTGVQVLALCPGFTYTEFHDVNGTREALNKLPKFMMMDADQCAQLGLHALEKDRVVYITGRVNRGLALLPRWLPNAVSRKIMARNSNKFRKT